MTATPRTCRSLRRAPRLMTFDEEMQDLVERGFIEVYLDGKGERRVRLTERGHAVAMAQKAEKERNERCGEDDRTT